MAIVELWWQIAQDSMRRDSDRLEASKLLAERGWGKAAAFAEVEAASRPDRPPTLDDAAAAPTMTARRSSQEPGGIVPREVYGASQATGKGGA
jgi:hypothetical protein